MMESADVTSMAQETALGADAQSNRLTLERLAATAVADDEELKARLVQRQRREGLEKKIETLLRFEPADSADDDVSRLDVERLTRRADVGGSPAERVGIDRIQHHLDALWPGAGPDQIVLDIRRNRDHARESRQQPFVTGIVHPQLTGGIARPAVRGRDGVNAESL